MMQQPPSAQAVKRDTDHDPHREKNEQTSAITSGSSSPPISYLQIVTTATANAQHISLNQTVLTISVPAAPLGHFVSLLPELLFSFR
jgi:hypothetical protein